MAWLNRDRAARDSKTDRVYHDEITTQRLRRLQSLTTHVEAGNPQEVETRLRNLSHGTNGT